MGSAMHSDHARFGSPRLVPAPPHRTLTDPPPCPSPPLPLPPLLPLQLYYAAKRGPLWRSGWGYNNSLLQGMEVFEVGWGGANTSGIHLALLTGWGLNITNLLLTPLTPPGPLPPETFQPPPSPASGSSPSIFGGGSASGGNSSTADLTRSTKEVVGIVVGVGGGAAILTAAILILFFRRKL